MKNKENRLEEGADLRRRAEELAQENAAQSPQDLAFLSPEESNNTLHELRVHQIELEMQNEELRRTQFELETQNEELRRHEFELITARERYFNLYDLAPVGYVTLSEQGLILEANLTAAGLLGVARGTLVKQPLSRFIVKEDQDNHYLHRKQLFESGEAQNYELRMLRKDGQVFWAHLAAIAAPDKEGTRLCSAVISDITERKLAEEKLIDSELFFNTTINSLKGHICVLDETGKIVLTNQAWDDFAIANSADPQCVSEGVNYLSVCDSVTGPDLESASSCSRGIRAVLSGDSPEFNMEYPCHSPTKKRWFLGKVSPLQGKYSRWVVINHENITERKLSEEAIQIKNQMFEDSIAAHSIADSLEKMTHVNQAFLRIWGYTNKEQIIGNSISFLFNDHADAVPVLEALTSHDAWEGEFLAKRADGTTFFSRGFATSLRNTRGKLIGYQSTNIDVTKEREAQEEVLHSRRQQELILSSAAEGILGLDFQGNHTFVNPAAARMLGYTVEELIGCPSHSLWHHTKPDGNPYLEEECLMHAAYHKGQVHGSEAEVFWRKDGTSFPADYASTPIIDQGQVLGTVVTFEDISKQKQREEQDARMLFMQQRLNTFMLEQHNLTDYEQLIKTIVKQVDELLSPIATAFSEYDQGARVLRVKDFKANQSILNLLVKIGGKRVFSADTPVNDDRYNEMTTERVKIVSTLHEVLGGAFSKTISSRIDKALKIKCYFGFSFVIDDKVFGTTVVALKEEPEYYVMELLKSYAHYIAVSLKRTLSEQALRDSKALYDQLAEQSHTIAWETDANGKYTYINSVVKDLIGYYPEEIVGRMHFYDFYPEEKREELKAPALSAMRNKEIFTNLDKCIEAKDGSIRYVTTNSRPIFNADGSLRGYRGSDIDITERKQAEEALRSKKMMIERTEGIAHIGSWTWNIATDKVTWSDELFRIFQRDPQEGAPSFAEHAAIYHPEDMARLRQVVEAAITDGTSYELELRAIRKDGETRVCVARGISENELGGRAVSLFGSLQDITERKQAEEKFKTVFESANVGKSITLLTGEIDFNQSFCDMLGYPREELKNKKWQDITPEDDISYLQNKLEPLMKGEKDSARFEKRYICKNGTHIWADVSISIQRGFRGEPLFLITTAIDITERKQAEKELQNSLKKTQKILDNLQDAFIQADQTGNIVFINPAVTKMFGYNKSEEMIGKPALTLYADAKERDRLIETLKEAGSVNEFITKGLRKDGSTFWASVNARFNRNEAGEINGVEGEIRDISERIKSTEEIEHHRNVLDLRLNQTVNVISKIGELRDAYTAGHQKRVSELACAIASKMGLPDEQIHNLSFGGLIHDIGKFMIPSDILNKPSKISDLEYKLIQTHVEESYKVVKEIDFPVEIHTMVYQHHERLDGSGYPQGLSGDEIILESRILGVADVIDAMSSHRPYRAAFSIDTALEEILLHRGTKYDAKVVDVCIKLIKEDGYVL